MIVDVIGPVAVAALLSGNETVDVIETVDDADATSGSTARCSSMLYFQKLDVYKRSIEFLAVALRVRQSLPKGHVDLVDPLRRAAQSVPQNIAEGCGRTTRADKAKHYAVARGSAMESAAHLDVMRVEELIDAELYARGIELLERVVAMLTKLIDP